MSVKTCEVLIILLIENCLACYADRSWVHYADTKLRYEVAQDDLSVFQQALGVPVADAVSKLKLKSTAALPPSLTLQVIERS